MYQGEEKAETLEITLEDKYKNLQVVLYYGVFENLDVITRACKIVNKGEDKVRLLRAYSMALDFDHKDLDFLLLYYGVFENLDVITRACKIVNKGEDKVRLLRAYSMALDFDHKDLDFLHFYGRHAMERKMERSPLQHGFQGVESRRGYSSHQQNPFAVLCKPDATEEYGWCYGASFVYSGNFSIQAEVSQADTTRLTVGIQDTQFEFHLQKNMDGAMVHLLYIAETFPFRQRFPRQILHALP